MYAINNELAQQCIEADGRYLDAVEIRTFEKYVEGYQARLHAYQEVHQNSDALVLNALKKFSRRYPDVIRKSGKRCHYDMSSTLRYAALSMLRDDVLFFEETLTIWLDTVLVAHQKHSKCSEAYVHLLEEISHNLSHDAANLIKPYMDSVIQILDSHVN
ncbi:MAG: phycobilisome protein [Leptolyngbyaceae bacterium]|nr:phycobilisome protein [Leptolyngbyaceae bacterium]